MRRIQVVTAVLAGALLAAPVTAQRGSGQRPPAQQRPPQPRQQTPTFRSSTQYVAVDVIVTDRSDRVVTDLAREDFTITENGQTQTIDDFSFVSVPLENRTIDLEAPPLPPSDVGSNASQPRASRAMAFVIDDHEIKPKDLIPLRRAMVQFLQQLSSDDQVAVTYIARSDLSQDFTNDIGRLIETIKAQKDAFTMGEMSPRTPGREKLFVLENAIKTLTAARQPRRAIVLVSATGCLPIGPDMIHAACRDLISNAQKAGVPIYTLDPRLFNGQTDEQAAPAAPAGESGRTPFGEAIDSMRSLANLTGGRGFAGMAEVPRAVREILTENGSYYLLGFYPKPIINDGKFHEIEVKVNRPGLIVRARKGYNADPAEPKVLSPTKAMTAALGAGLDDPSLPVRAVVAPMAPGLGGKTRAVVTLELRYPRADTDMRTLDDELRVGILALTPDAKIKASFQRDYQFTGTWKPTARGTFVINEVIDLPTETLTVRVGVTSNALGKTGTTHVEVDVPDYRDDKVQLSSLVIGTPQYSLDAAVGLDTIRALVPYQPATSRTFSNADTLRVFARVYWRTKYPETDVRVSVQGPSPIPAQSTTITGQRGPTGHILGRFNTSLPLRGLSPGPYVLRVEASQPNGKSFVREVPFEIK
jgi:VWFA-related protein